jgi:xanthine dehydrogenase accessory factor
VVDGASLEVAPAEVDLRTFEGSSQQTKAVFGGIVDTFDAVLDPQFVQYKANHLDEGNSSEAEYRSFVSTLAGGERLLVGDLVRRPDQQLLGVEAAERWNPPYVQCGDPGVCGGELEVYLEPYLPPATVFIVGAGHVGQAVAELAHWLGYRVVVHDDREDLATEEAVPDADVYLPGTIDEALSQHKITRNTFVVLTTRNVMVDREVLPQLAGTPAPYVGVIGSRKRWQHTKELLAEEGLSEEQLARFHSPIGLELNAETPEEIAVSIMSEIIMLRRGGTGDRMSE